MRERGRRPVPALVELVLAFIRETFRHSQPIGYLIMRLSTLRDKQCHSIANSNRETLFSKSADSEIFSEKVAVFGSPRFAHLS